MEMTSRERIEAALRHETPDRTPIFEYVLLSPVADCLLGEPYARDPSHWPDALDELGWRGAVEKCARQQLDLARLLGHDMMYVYPTPSPGETDSALHASPADLPEDPVERLSRRNEESAQTSPIPADEELLVYSILKEEMQRRGIDLPILAPAYNHGVWTDVDLMMTMLIEPEVAHEHFALATGRATAAVEGYASMGLDQAGVGGDFAGNRPIISPEAYRTFIVPEVRAVSRRAHELGLWTVNASDGDLWPVIDDFLIGCEVDGYLEIDMQAGMGLRELKAAYGDRITFYGNLDCGNVLSFASPDEVRCGTRECLEAGQGSGGHILCASNAITASVPLDNYLAVVEAYRGFFGLTPPMFPGR
jgi:uroporphyrinogen decarboxylase-like protein